MKSFSASLEILEQRIAPAVITYLNPAGTTVTVTTSKGTMDDISHAATFAVSGQGKILQQLDLTSNPVFRGTDLSILADGTAVADVGAILAQGFDLGMVSIDGDVGHIDAGDLNLKTAALKSLHVGSLGSNTTTQTGTPTFESLITGPLTTLEVDHNLAGTLLVQGNSASKITTATIHGSIVGGSTAQSGSLNVGGGIDTLVIDQDIAGGSGPHSGSVQAGGTIRSATITGSIIGGLGVTSGFFTTTRDILTLNIHGGITGKVDAGSLGENAEVMAHKITTATITGAITGGTKDLSGAVRTSAGFGSITVTGGLQGGDGRESGVVATPAAITKAVIGTGIQGGMGDLSGSVLGTTLTSVEVNGDVTGGMGKISGGISSVGTIVKALIHGKLTGGAGDNSGSIGSTGSIGTAEVQQGIFGAGGAQSGSISATVKIGTATVGVGLTGGLGAFSGTVGTLGAIGAVHVEGSVTGGSGTAGGINSGAILAGTTISSVTVDGSLVGTALQSSGRIEANVLTSVKIGGSIMGGSGQDSGVVHARTSMGKIDVTQSVVGFGGSAAKTPLNNGQIFSEGPIASVHVGVNLQGGDAFSSGSIISRGTVASVAIDGSMVGGAGINSGSIIVQSLNGGPVSSQPALTKAVIGDYLLGGIGTRSGSIVSGGKIGSVDVGSGAPPIQVLLAVHPNAMVPGGPVQPGLNGGSGPFSGSIIAGDSITTINIVGDLAGSGNESAEISSEANITKITIGGGVSGQGAYDTGALSGFLSGQITARGTIASLDIHGDVLGGSGNASGAITAGTLSKIVIHNNLISGQGVFSGAIRAVTGDLTSLTVAGQITNQSDGQDLDITAQRNIGAIAAGNIRGTGGRIFILAGGVANPKTAAAAVAIGSVKTAGVMSDTTIASGVVLTSDSFSLNSQSASIGTVEVGTGGRQDDIYSDNDIYAGVFPGGGLGNRTNSLVSKISSVIVHGSVAVDRFDGSPITHVIEADQVVSVKIDGVATALVAGARNDQSTPVATGATTFVIERQPT